MVSGHSAPRTRSSIAPNPTGLAWLGSPSSSAGLAPLIAPMPTSTHYEKSVGSEEEKRRTYLSHKVAASLTSVSPFPRCETFPFSSNVDNRSKKKGEIRGEIFSTILSFSFFSSPRTNRIFLATFIAYNSLNIAFHTCNIWHR